MARTTKQLSGGGKDKFLRVIATADTGIPAAAAKRLGDALCEAITEVRVRREVWEAKSKSAPGEKGLRAKSKSTPATAPAEVRPASTPADRASVAAAAVVAFDPFAFSAVAVLTRKGKDALAAELAKIDAPSDLKAIATAQHLAIDLAIDDAAQLRTALVTATERRIAERRAAAG